MTRRRRSTANRTWAIFRAGLNHAFHTGKIESDSAWRKVKPFKGVDAPRVRWLTVAEAKRFINACDPDFRLLAEAALLTGCRYGELGRLEVRDFDPDNGTIAIRTSKSGRPRHVVLTEEGVALFRQVAAGRSGHEIMLRRANGRAWQKSDQQSAAALACKRAAISPPITFHGLRHSYASLAVQNGTPLMVVARNLGHSNIKMLERHYGHLAPSYIADEIRRGAPKFGFERDTKIVALP
jgi:integrase